MTMTEYTWAAGIDCWGDGTITDEEHASACGRAEDWLTEHEGDDLSISVRPARRGEADGIYLHLDEGGYQILGYSFAVPDEVSDLTARAYEHALETWGDNG